MSDQTLRSDDDDLEIPEITDWSGGVVGKYYAEYQEFKRRRLLDQDLAAEFPDSDSVNRALRQVLHQRGRKPAPSAAKTR